MDIIEDVQDWHGVCLMDPPCSKDTGPIMVRAKYPRLECVRPMSIAPSLLSRLLGISSCRASMYRVMIRMRPEIDRI